MKRIYRTLFLLALVGLLSACASPKPQPDEGGAAGGPTGQPDDRRGVIDGGPQDARSLLNDPQSPLAQRVIYFDFDSAEISAEDRAVLAAHAEFLAAHPDVSVVLEGHADERGTREYNMALGERRAKAVLQLLVLQGVSPSQGQPISFGEERPVALGHDEASWRVNRRVELLYSGY
ncbi:MAG TPA: peptidoglycan-associated lipoprotein Pal [Gammaproteobacteria bacterium]|nr:peptidoglycan-associated lipoprotein Pal [Gammaproteobacteria bacterium]